MGFFQNKSVRMLIAVVLVLCGLWLITANTGNGILSSIVNTVAYPFRMSAWSVGKTAENGKTASELQAENEKLKGQLRDANNKLVDYYDIKQENAQLRKYFNIKKDNSDYELMPASVINRDPNEKFYGFTVNKGSASGVSVNDPVLTENGLIGWVSHVDPASCTVTTILSPKTKISAVCKASKDTGVITGRSDICDDNLTALTVLTEQNKIETGDIIVTTGMGGVYPPDLVIGTVSEVKYDAFDMSLFAVIEPYEDIKSISDVVIVTGFNSTETEVD